MIKKIILAQEVEAIEYDGFNYHEIETFIDKACGWITNINDSTQGKLEEIIITYKDCDGELIDVRCKIGDNVTIDQEDNIRVIRKTQNKTGNYVAE